MSKRFLQNMLNVDMNSKFVSAKSADDWGKYFQSEYCEFLRSVKVGKHWYCVYRYYLA